MPETGPGEDRSNKEDVTREEETCKGGTKHPPLQVPFSLAASPMQLLNSPGFASGTDTVQDGGEEEDGLVGGWV